MAVEGLSLPIFSLSLMCQNFSFYCPIISIKVRSSVIYIDLLELHIDILILHQVNYSLGLNNS